MTESGDAPKPPRPENDKVRRSLDMQKLSQSESRCELSQSEARCELEETFDLEATVALGTTQCQDETFSNIDETLLKASVAKLTPKIDNCYFSILNTVFTYYV